MQVSVVRTLRAVVVLLVAVVFGSSLVLPTEDLPGTSYDESEALAFECTPMFQVPVSGVIRPSAPASIVPGARTKIPGARVCCSDSLPSLTILDCVFRC